MGDSVCVCMSVYMHAHTHCRVLGCEPRGRDETPGGPKNPDGLNLGMYCSYVCTKYTCVCLCEEAG